MSPKVADVLHDKVMHRGDGAQEPGYNYRHRHHDNQHQPPDTSHLPHRSYPLPLAHDRRHQLQQQHQQKAPVSSAYDETYGDRAGGEGEDVKDLRIDPAVCLQQRSSPPEESLARLDCHRRTSPPEAEARFDHPLDTAAPREGRSPQDSAPRVDFFRATPPQDRKFDHNRGGTPSQEPQVRFDHRGTSPQEPQSRFDHRGTSPQEPQSRFDRRGTSPQELQARFDHRGTSPQEPQARFDHRGTSPQARFDHRETSPQEPQARFDHRGTPPQARFDHRETSPQEPQARFDHRGTSPQARFDHRGTSPQAPQSRFDQGREASPEESQARFDFIRDAVRGDSPPARVDRQTGTSASPPRELPSAGHSPDGGAGDPRRAGSSPTARNLFGFAAARGLPPSSSSSSSSDPPAPPRVSFASSSPAVLRTAMVTSTPAQTEESRKNAQRYADTDFDGLCAVLCCDLGWL